MHSQQGIVEDPEPNTLLIEDPSLHHGFVQLPKLVLYARNLSRDAKLLYAVLLGYAWQEQRCWPGYTRLCDDLGASENMVRKYMRELEAVHLLSQRRRGLGLSNIYTLHDLRTAKIEVQEPHKTKVQEPHKTAVLEPHKSEDYEETKEKETKEKQTTDRSIGERPVKRSRENAENGEKALVGGEPTESAPGAPVNQRVLTTGVRRVSTRGTQMKEQDISPRDQALAHARAVVGTAIEEQLRELGGAHPAGGADTILEAWVDVQTPCEAMGALLKVGTRRLEQQQERIHIPNPTGYLISTLRHLAEEGMLKGWNVDQMQAEDEEKHAQAVRSAAQAGNTVLTYDGPALLPEEESPSEVLEVADTTPRAALIPNMPGGVEVADAATVAAWQDHVPDPQGGQARSVSMLWGFVREAIRGPLNIARQQQLDALIPKWDATRPRTLLLLCDLTYTARAVELNLRREIEPQIRKLLSDYFDELQVVYAPGQEDRV